MITGYPLHGSSTPVLPDRIPPSRPAAARARTEAYRYDGARKSHRALLVAALISAGLHVFVIFGVHPPAARKAKPVEDEKIILFTVQPLKPEELEDVEVVPRDEEQPKDVAMPVPMQADVLRTVQPNDFVQKVDMSSLLQQPDLSQAKVLTIPEHYTRAGNLAEKIGKIFNLADLDHIPEPIIQQAPIYPPSLKREGLSATVRIEFIVDTRGQVLDPFVVDTTHPGFNEAALAGVSRWRFRPGVKMGRTVNTRMQVPIVFKVTDGIE